MRVFIKRKSWLKESQNRDNNVQIIFGSRLSLVNNVISYQNIVNTSYTVESGSYYYVCLFPAKAHELGEVRLA